MQYIWQYYSFTFVQVSNRGEAHLELNAFRRKHDCALVISGDSLEVHQHSMPHTVKCFHRKWLWSLRKKQIMPSDKNENILVLRNRHFVWSVFIDLLLKTSEFFWILFSCLAYCIWVYTVLQMCLRYYEHEFVELACQCPAVVCCRCSPTQKAQIVALLQQHTANRTCAIGKWWARQQRHVHLRLLPVGVGIKLLSKFL